MCRAWANALQELGVCNKPDFVSVGSFGIIGSSHWTITPVRAEQKMAVGRLLAPETDVTQLVLIEFIKRP